MSRITSTKWTVTTHPRLSWRGEFSVTYTRCSWCCQPTLESCRRCSVRSGPTEPNARQTERNALCEDCRQNHAYCKDCCGWRPCSRLLCERQCKYECAVCTTRRFCSWDCFHVDWDHGIHHQIKCGPVKREDALCYYGPRGEVPADCRKQYWVAPECSLCKVRTGNTCDACDSVPLCTLCKAIYEMCHDCDPEGT